MELQREPILETVNEDLAGTTYSTFLPVSRVGLMAVYDPSLHRLMLRTRSGDCEWQSEWLACESRLPSRDTDQLIQEAVKLWLLRTGLLSPEQRNGLTPLELATRTMNQFEHVLA